MAQYDGSIKIDTKVDKKGFTDGLDNLKNAGSTAVKAIGGLVAGATAAVTAFAKSSVETGMAFDSSMSQVAATMGTTVDQIQDLRDFAQEMGAKTAFSATQAADALNYMALAGYDADTSMAMLPNVLNLAAAGGMELASASDMITDSQSALGLTLEDTSKLVDKMAKASSKSNTSVAQLGEAILTVGGTAKNMAGGTTELTTALGILADNGTKGAEGGTKLRNILLSLGAPTDKAAKLLKSLSVDAYDADGNMRPLKDTFADLNRAMEGMTDAQKTDIINTLFNKADLKDVNALLATSTDRWDELSAAIDESAGAAQAMADTQLDNLAGDITLFESALEGVQIAISDNLSPTLREFVQFGSDGLSKLTEAFKTDGLAGAMDTFGDILADGVNQISAWLPKATTVGTDLLLAVVDGLVTALPSLGTAAIQIISNFANGLAAAAPSLIPAAVEAVLGFAMALIEPGNINALIDSALALIMGLADGIINAIPVLIDAIPDIIESLVAALITNAPKIALASVELILKLAEGLIDALPLLVMIIPKVAEAIYTAFKETDWKELGNDIVDGLKNGIVAKIAEIQVKVQELGEAIKERFCNFFGIHSPSTVMQEIGGYLVDGLVDGLKNLPEKALQFFTDLKNKIVSWGADAKGKLTEIGGHFITALSGAIKELPAKAIAIFNDLKAKITSWGTAVKELITATGSTMVTNLVNAVTNMPSRVIAFFTDLKTRITSWGAEVKSLITTIGGAVVTNLVNAVTSLPSRVITLFNQLKNQISSWGSAVKSLVTSTGSAMVSSLVSAVTSMPSKVMALFNQLKTQLTSWGSSIKSSMKSIGSNLVTGLWNGINDKVSWITDKIKGFGESVLNAIKKTLGINSPSKITAGYGEYLAQGLEVGFNKEMPKIKSGILGDLKGMTGKMRAVVALESGRIAENTAGGNVTNSHVTNTTTYQQKLNFYQPIQTPSQVARAARKALEVT